VPGSHQHETFRSLAATLLLTYALRNADCHAKNLAMLYTSWNNVHLSPAYDFLTTNVYASYQHNPPGIGFMGKKTWTPGKTLPRFIAGTFGISIREQAVLVEAIGDAVAEVVPLVQEKMAEHPDFRDLGKRMLLAWQQGVNGLREKRVYASGDWPGDEVFERISDPPKLVNLSTAIGRSPLMGDRSRRPQK
jgi:serine/threonine-protein kinase HipA